MPLAKWVRPPGVTASVRDEQWLNPLVTTRQDERWGIVWWAAETIAWTLALRSEWVAVPR